MEYVIFSLMFLLIVFNLTGIIKQIPQLIMDIQLRWYRSIRYSLLSITWYAISTWIAVSIINKLL